MGNNGFLLDTTALIDFFCGKENTVTLISQMANEMLLAVSSITIVEIFSGIRETEIEFVEEFLSSLIQFPVDFKISRRAGLYQKEYRSKGITLGLADCLIAATAVEHGLILVTKNVRHFPMPELSVIEH